MSGKRWLSIWVPGYPDGRGRYPQIQMAQNTLEIRMCLNGISRNWNICERMYLKTSVWIQIGPNGVHVAHNGSWSAQGFPKGVRLVRKNIRNLFMDLKTIWMLSDVPQASLVSILMTSYEETRETSINMNPDGTRRLSNSLSSILSSTNILHFPTAGREGESRILPHQLFRSRAGVLQMICNRGQTVSSWFWAFWE